MPSTTVEQRKSALATALFMGIFFMILFVVQISKDERFEEEGILINFGDSEQGMGEVEPRPQEVAQMPQTQPKSEPIPTTNQPSEGQEEVMNQDFEEAAAIAKKEEAKRIKAEEEKVRKAKLEEERMLKQLEEQRKAEEARKAAEQQYLAQQQSKAQNAFAGRNVNGGKTGEGVTGNQGNQGSPNGDVNSTNRVGGGAGNGINFNLTGRSFGSVPPKPNYLSKAEGKVVVEIKVDRNGNVIEATPGKAGSTTTDQTLYKAAKEAALLTKFDSNPNAAAVQVGTITYQFIQQ
ncbi:MAG: hypothetical protein MJ069_05285 [Salinivirgaceae bacterium]|nr:hypothetical protein [Salinivirgaceae bacterium]